MKQSIDNNGLVKEFRASLENNLLSAISYGPEHKRYLVFLDKLDIGILDSIAKTIKEWEKKSEEIIFMKHSEIDSNTKIFPLEFLNMKMDYNLLYGKDVLANLKFEESDVIRELRFFLRSKLINLRKGYVAACKNRRNLLKLVTHAFPTLMPVCCGMFFLKKKLHPNNCSTMLAQLSSDYKIDLSVLDKINIMKNKKVNKEELKNYTNSLIILLELLFKLINHMESKR